MTNLSDMALVHMRRAARFHWHVALPDGIALPEGTDLAELSEDGTKIRRIVGFFGPLK